MLAMFLTMKASPGWKSRMCDGQTRESEHANTKNCTSDSTSPLNYDTGLDLWDWGKKKGEGDGDGEEISVLRTNRWSISLPHFN